MVVVIPPVVDAEFVANHPEAVLADVRWYLDGRDGRAAFEAGHLPGARWVDLDHQLAGHDAPATAGRHPFPTSQAFAAAMTDLGIGDDSVVVAYDDTGGLTAGRLVVMLRMLGCNAALLDGGLRTWTGAIDIGPGPAAPAPAAPFTPRPWPAERFADADLTAATAAGDGVVLDARAYERYTGEVAQIDPRPGHIPGARSAPWSAVLDSDGRFASVERLREHYGAVGVAATSGDPASDPALIAYCGSGVSACMNVLGLEHAGLAPARLYVASWSGWSADPDRPTETGGRHGS